MPLLPLACTPSHADNHWLNRNRLLGGFPSHQAHPVITSERASPLSPCRHLSQIGEAAANSGVTDTQSTCAFLCTTRTGEPAVGYLGRTCCSHRERVPTRSRAPASPLSTCTAHPDGVHSTTHALCWVELFSALSLAVAVLAGETADTVPPLALRQISFSLLASLCLVHSAPHRQLCV